MPELRRSMRVRDLEPGMRVSYSDTYGNIRGNVVRVDDADRYGTRIAIRRTDSGGPGVGPDGTWLLTRSGDRCRVSVVIITVDDTTSGQRIQFRYHGERITATVTTRGLCRRDDGVLGGGARGEWILDEYVEDLVFLCWAMDDPASGTVLAPAWRASMPSFASARLANGGRRGPRVPVPVRTPARNPSFVDDYANRTCPRCNNQLPASAAYFYMTPSTGRLGYCIPCTADYSASRRRGTHKGRKFGVELEFVGAEHRDVAEAAQANGLMAEMQEYNHRVTRKWKIVHDGSLCGGGELVSPVLRGELGLERIDKASAALHAAGARADVSCGMHVHHDIRDLAAGQVHALAEFWFATQQTIELLVAPSRRGGTEDGSCPAGSRWCRRLDSYAIDYVKRFTARDRLPHGSGGVLRDLDRYYALNFQSYGRQGTVEIRLHHGTINAKKIKTWVQFGQAVIDAGKQGVDAPSRTGHNATDVSALLGCLPGLSDDTASFLEERQSLRA